MGVRESGEGKCEGKKATLTLTLTPFITVCQPVTAKSEGVRVKNKKKLFQPYSSKPFLSIMSPILYRYGLTLLVCARTNRWNIGKSNATSFLFIGSKDFICKFTQKSELYSTFIKKTYLCND